MFGFFLDLKKKNLLIKVVIWNLKLNMEHGKNMVRWLMFDTLKSPHFTLVIIHAFTIIKL
jgi:isoprenylcysteine carboxyl methyltransferase (ICMT) family protein YpbQ